MYLDFLGGGLFRELAGQCGDLFFDRGLVTMTDLEVAVQQEPQSAARHRELGRRLLQDAKPKMARDCFRKALLIDPGDSPSRVGLACALESMGMVQTAIDELRVCLSKRPEYRPAMVAMDYCLHKLGDPAAASDNHIESPEAVSVG